MIRDKKQVNRVMYWLLTKIGYKIPYDFQMPSKKVFVALYVMISSIVVYAVISVIDDLTGETFSVIGFFLRLFSSLTIIATASYKKKKRRSEIIREKNRRYLKKNYKSPILNQRIYFIPMYVEIVSMMLFALITIVAWLFGRDVVINTYKILIIGQAVINLIFSCVDIYSDFYRAQDVSYTY